MWSELRGAQKETWMQGALQGMLFAMRGKRVWFSIALGWGVSIRQLLGRIGGAGKRALLEDMGPITKLVRVLRP